ncbi:flagellar hook-associated protein FlgK [Croceibacterium ferulae]|uniref:flagellar hook-associated protein FlgK n=1 Tax=Croceibacterium ferulae TaxID=1854641 RepID=UPI000EB53651|nr:flagellar hook-associated protein FlgK [Croceibacterium ferulae]
MASDLLTIGAAGAKAARAALDVTAHNIANASTEGYIRRSARLEELAGRGVFPYGGDINLSGARVGSIHRNADAFRQAEVRRTAGDLARSDTDLAALREIETALEDTAIFDSVVEFEAALQQLSNNPNDPALRAVVLAQADAMAGKFNLAAQGLDASVDGMHFEAGADVAQVNQLGAELARVNVSLARATNGSTDKAALLDRRDLLLGELSTHADSSAEFAADGTVSVRLGGAAGALFVEGNVAGTLAMDIAADNTLSFAVNGAALSISGGSLGGAQAGVANANTFHTRLDALADGIAQTVNEAQAAGVDLTGATGQPIFAGTGAAGMRMVLASGGGIAAAAAGAPANSRDGTNLMALRQAVATLDPAGDMNLLLFDASALVAARTLSNEALGTIASSAKIVLQQQAGVDLDTEAANLIRFQQAFQASSRAMQVASDLFDTLIGIR